MVGQLSKLELDLTDDNIIKIVDLLPETVDDVRAIFAKERFRYNEEEIKKIITMDEKIQEEKGDESKLQLEAQAHSLIDGANKFESEGNINDAVVNLVSAITLHSPSSLRYLLKL